jgi:mono/diheme cytochrome c family protein
MAHHALRVVASVVLLASLLAGCGSPRRSEPVVGPLALDEHLERGRHAFDQHCYKCHTGGEGGMGPIINDKPLPKFLMRLQTRAGIGAMPSFSKDEISDQELEALLDYLVAVRRASPSPAAVGSSR